nr:hypothetical protein [Tanacetum cinerariifolium]
MQRSLLECSSIHQRISRFLRLCRFGKLGTPLDLVAYMSLRPQPLVPLTEQAFQKILTETCLLGYIIPVSTDVPKTSVTRPRQAKTVVTRTHSPPGRHINHSPSLKASTFPPKVTAVKAPMVNAAQVSKNNLMQKSRGGNCLTICAFSCLVFWFYKSLEHCGDAAFDEKEPEFEGRKPEFEVNVFPSSSVQSKKHDDKTKREAKGKSPVESLTRYRNLSAEFEDFFNKSINEDNAADTSQLPNDPNTPELEDITYSDDEDDVGAEADFNNLEISVTVSPIPTTRVHKDHHVTQFIGDLSLATQTKSMTRVAKDQGRISQINNDDFYTCMFACFLLQEEPKRVHQALKDPSWIEAMQDELL